MKKFEGSPQDKKEDKSNAKKYGMSLKKYEKSAIDKKKDKEGQKKMEKKK